MELKEIQELIKFVSRSGVSEVELEFKDIKITIKTPPRKKRGEFIPTDNDPIVIQTQVPAAPAVAPQPTQVVVAQPVESKEAAEGKPETVAKSEEAVDVDDSKFETIKSPMIGTFYRASAPDKPPFLNVGDDINPGDIICIIEAMKLFNEIEAEVSGKIVKVLVDDSTPVEYDQPIFLIEPH